MLFLGMASDSCEGDEGVVVSRCGWSTCCSGCACCRMQPPPRAPPASCRTWCVLTDAVHNLQGHTCIMLQGMQVQDAAVVQEGCNCSMDLR